jgi:trk system potassium uptake protein TrkH
VVSAGTLLSYVEQVDFINALFEVVSGFGTVGLTTGLTPELSAVGRVIVMITIFTGRVGLLTVAFALSRQHRPANFRYPEERIYVG